MVHVSKTGIRRILPSLVQSLAKVGHPEPKERDKT
jgi:hypothetical protein